MKVITFQQRFASLVKEGRKPHTIRPRRVNAIKPGDKLSLRQWSGRPYRSKQKKLMETTCTHVAEFQLESYALMKINGQRLHLDEQESLAKVDGFKDLCEMINWFEKTHELPFNGVIIYWEPFPKK